MAGICFYFEDSTVDVFSGGPFDMEPWNYAAKMGGVDRFAIINQSGQKTRSPDGACETLWIADPSELVGRVAYLNTPEHGGMSCWGMKHETFDWYAFGPARGWGRALRPDTYHIPGGTLHSVHAASVIMAHRHHILNP